MYEENDRAQVFSYIFIQKQKAQSSYIYESYNYVNLTIIQFVNYELRII